MAIVVRRGICSGIRCGWHHFSLRELLDLHCSFVVDLLASQSLVHELLRGVDHAQVSLGLGKLRIQIKLHQLLKALISILRQRVSQQALDPSNPTPILTVRIGLLGRSLPARHCGTLVVQYMLLLLF